MKIRQLLIYSLMTLTFTVQIKEASSITMENVCPIVVESSLDPIFYFIESIRKKSNLNISRSHTGVYDAINRWKRGEVNSIRIETLLQMAYFLGTHPSTLLRLKRDMIPSVQINDEDVLQALNTRRPLSIDMLRYLGYKKTLPIEYIHYIESRPPLSDESIHQLLDHIHSQLKNGISELYHTMRSSLENQISIAYLSQEVEVNPILMQQIMYHHHLPIFSKLEHVLRAIGTDPITFFEIIEASEKFQILFQPVRMSHGQRLTLTQRQRVRFIGDRIQRAMNLRGMGSTRSLSYLTGLRKTPLNRAERDIALSSFVYTSFASEIPLSVLVSSEPLESYAADYIYSERSQDEVRAEKISGDYMMKFRQAFNHFIRWKMNKQSISISEFSRNSSLRVDTLKSIVIDGYLPKYLTLLRIVQNGFKQDMVSFFQEFEFYVESLQAHTLNTVNPYLRFERSIKDYDLDQVVELDEDLAHYSSSYKSVIVEDAFTSFHHRVLEAIDLTSLSINKIINITKIYIDKWDSDLLIRMKVSNIIRLVHFLGITPFQLLGTQPLSELINPENFNDERLSQYTPSSEMEVQLALNRLSTNIQEQKGDWISDQDLQVRLAVFDITELNPILYGESSATLFKLFQVTEALAWKRSSLAPPENAQTDMIYTPPTSSQDFYNMLEILLEGVTLSNP